MKYYLHHSGLSCITNYILLVTILLKISYNNNVVITMRAYYDVNPLKLQTVVEANDYIK